MSLKALIGAMRVDLLIDSAAFMKGAAETQHSFAALQRDFYRTGKKIQAIGENLSLKITAPLAAIGLAVGGATSSLTALKDQAALASMGTTEFKSLAIAAGSFGVEQEQLAGILKDVNDRVGEFNQTGGGPMADFFENIAPKVGITADSFRDLSGKDALQLYVKALQDAGLGQEEMTFYMEAMAGDAAKLLPVFADNGKVIQEVADRARELGMVIDDDLIESARHAGRDFSIVKEIMGVQMQQALVQLAPAFQDLGKAILPVVESIARGVSSAAQAFSALSPETQGFIVAAAGIAAALGPALVVLGAAVGGIAALISPVGLAVAGVTALVAGGVALYMNWDEVVAKVSGWAGALGEWAMSFEPVRAVVAHVSDGIASMRQVASDAFGLIINLMNGDWAAAWQSTKDLVGSIGEYINTMLLGLPQAAWDALGALSTAFGETMDRLVADMSRWAGDVIDGFVQGFQNRIASARDAVTGFAGDVGGWFKDTLGIQSPSRVFAEYGDNVVQGLVVGIDRSSDAAVKAMDDLAKRLKDAGKGAVDGMVSTFADGLAKGDIAGGIQGAFSGYMKNAQTAAGDMLKTAFSGGGLKSIGATISGAFKGIGAAFSGGAGFMAGIGGALSAALPLVGVVTGIASLISSFSSSKVLDSGVDLGVSGGAISGQSYTETERSSFWGLIKRRDTQLGALDGELAGALNGNLAQIQDGLKDVYARAGLTVGNDVISAFEYNFGKISGQGKTKEELTQEITAKFSEYTEALSKSIGGVGSSLVAALADVIPVLKMSGQSLQGSFANMANAADSLTKLFGGVDKMGGYVGGFVDKFFTDAQKLELVNKDVSAAFANIGLAVPDTIAGFRELVLGQDLMTDAGRANYAALLKVSDSFAFVKEASEEADKAMKAIEFEAAQKTAEEMKKAAEEMQRAAEQAFSALDGLYASEFDARLAQIGQANGYTVSAEVSRTGSVGNVALAINDKGLAVLEKIYDVLLVTRDQTAGNRL